MKELRKVAILGSGIMGSGIAAHLANCSIPSIMLDVVPDNAGGGGATDRELRNRIVLSNKKALLKAKPPALYRKTNFDLIDIGNFEDDLPRVAECDWIIEVVKEELDVKRQILEKVSRFRRPGSIVSTNTSGIPLGQISTVMDAEMREHFLGTHFFNPPRYMKLVEVIATPDTRSDVVDTISCFLEDVLGKGVVFAKDTPNFIANRILTFYCQYIIRNFQRFGLTIPDVDVLTGPAIGHAPSATFRTLDLVGLDTFLHVMRNVYSNCPSDEQRELFQPVSWMNEMIQRDFLGEKKGQGFYKRSGERDERGKSIILSLDLTSMEYALQKARDFECLKKSRKGLPAAEKYRILYFGEDEGAQFLWDVFAQTAIYTGNRIPEIADDIVNIDNAIKWGFNWTHGIFETWDMLGVRDVCDRMEKEGLTPPPIANELLSSGKQSFYKLHEGKTFYFDLSKKDYSEVLENPKVLRLQNLKTSQARIQETSSCSIVDLGDGIICAEFHSKMNTIDPDILTSLRLATDWVNEGKYDGIVIANQGDHFSAGANLKWILEEIRGKNWKKLEEAIRLFQDTNMALRFCKGPVVAAPHHYTFGGGIEISQHAARVVMAAETYGGLVEFGVGVIPGAGGTKEMLRRALQFAPESVPDVDPIPYVRRAFETIAMAKVSTSGPELVDLGYFTDADIVCVNWDQQISKAKKVCLGLVVSEYVPPTPARLVALGENAAAVFRSAVYQFKLGGFASEHDAVIAEKLAYVLTGGNRTEGAVMTEQDVLDLECEAFCFLCGTEKTQARIQYMLDTGKPLRN